MQKTYLAGCFIAFAVTASAQPAVRPIKFDNLHIRVTDGAAAGEWYVKYLGATPTAKDKWRVYFGPTLFVMVDSTSATVTPVTLPQPSAGTVVDHFAMSYPDVDAKIRELRTAGVKITKDPEQDPGFGKHAFIEDPWGTRIELLQDPATLGFHHVHLRVPNPQATLDWFEKMFGGSRAKLNGQVSGLRYNKVWLFAYDNSVDPVPGGDKPVPNNPRAIQEIAFHVPDINSTVAALKSRNVKFVRGRSTNIEEHVPRKQIIAGVETQWVFVEDPNSVRIELLAGDRGDCCTPGTYGAHTKK